MKWFFACISLCCLSFLTFANDRFVEHGDWQTFETEHFRVHFTPDYRDWAISAANELEQARSLIQAQQGRVLGPKVDAVVFDPFNAANGYAIPLENKPFTGLYATPPQSDSIISNSGCWQQLLVLHEYVHLVHLSQPERSFWRNQLGKAWDIFDITSIDTPRWAIEGYATLLESKTTGRGRLFNNQVEAILQQFAREGAMPIYAQLSQTDGRYLAGSMAYLVGARFLFWLEQNYGEDTLDKVWPRLRAKKARDFNAAFAGIYRKSPEQLYQRFAAEYTAQAINSELPLETTDPTLWLDIKDSASAPALSPNGELFALVQRDKDGRVSLNLYSTEDNSKAKEKFTKQQEKLVEADPEDIPDTLPVIFNPEQKHRLFERNFLRITNPRWVSDEQILFGSFTRNENGELHQDLSSWHIPSGKVKQISRGQNLRRFDVHPNGKDIIAERNRFGKSQLVRYNINSDTVEELTQATLDEVYDFPRINPANSNQVAFVSSKLNQSWQLQLTNLQTGEGKIVPAPKGYQFLSYPSWSPDGKHLYYVAGLANQLDVYRYELATDHLEKVTQGKQALAWPVIGQDNTLFTLATNSQGPDVQKLALPDAHITQITQRTESAQLANVFDYPYQLDPAAHNLDESRGTLRSYGAGPQDIVASVAASVNSSSFNIVELGLRGGDLLQRFTWQINASHSINNNGLSGISGSVRWQGWPVKITAHAFDISLEPFEQTDPILLGERDVKGAMLAVHYPWQNDTLSITPFARITTNSGVRDENSVQLGWQQSWYHNRRSWGLYQASQASWLEGETDGFANVVLANAIDWDGYDASIMLGGQYQKFRLEASARRNKRDGSALPLISLGGYSSTLFNGAAHPNRQFAPELSFEQNQSNDIRYYQVAAGHDNAPFLVIYGRYSLPIVSDIDVYGIKGKQRFNTEVLGASDLNLDYGLLQVNPENGDSELEAWLGMSYQF